jgi:phosphonate transport system substrate-binding protein
MAPNMEPMVAALADWLAVQLGLPVEFVSEPGWQQREQLFDQGQIDLIWICGLPYVWKADDGQPAVSLVAAPVMAGSRYHNQPVYYSDVVVASHSDFHSFEDLVGSRWAINEPRSHSGFGLTRYSLVQKGLDWGYFGSVMAAGSHQAALAALLAGEIDATAIDSTVLELAIRLDPALKHQIRTIDTFGPSPIPPWVARGGLEPDLRMRLQQALIGMHRQEPGRQVLGLAGISHLAVVEDSDYDPIRRMDRIGRQVADFEGLNA